MYYDAMEKMISATELAKELNTSRQNIRHRMGILGINHMFMGQRICRTAKEAQQVRDFRQIFRQGPKKKSTPGAE